MKSPVATDETYTPVTLERFEAQEWPLVADINDPRLGLTFEQLTASWEPLGLPQGWDPELAAQFTTGAWQVLSRVIGEMANERLRWPDIHRWLLATVVASVPPHPVAFESFAVGYYDALEVTGEIGVGIGSPRTAWQRLAEFFADGRRMRDVHSGLGSRGWSIDSRNDTQVLDEAWERARRAACGHDILAVLPVPVLCAFAPPRRHAVVSLTEGSGRREVQLHIPSAWELMATAIFLGPEEWHRRGVASITHAAGRDGGLAKPTMEVTAGTINGIARHIREATGGLAVTAPWREQRFSVRVPKSVAKGAKKIDPRIAPPLPRFRQADAIWAAKLPQARRTRQGSSLARSALVAHLRRLLYMHLGLQLRVNEICALRLDSIDAAHEFPNGYVGPAVYCEPSKESGVDPHWKALHSRTLALLEEWIELWDITPAGRDAPSPPLFAATEENRSETQLPERAGKFFAGAAGHNLPAVPHPDRHHYAIHEATRHLAARLAAGVGMEWSRADSESTDKVHPGVFVAAQLHQTFKTQSYDYEDLDANRELWALRAALGDPDKGIVGVLQLALGPEGARRRWDEAAIRSALSQIKASEVRLDEATESEQKELLSVAHLERRLAASPPSDDSAIEAAASSAIEGLDTSDAEKLHKLLLHIREDVRHIKATLDHERARHTLRDARDAAKHRLHLAEREIAAATAALQASRHSLELLEARGRSVKMPDTDPLPNERPTGAFVPEAESFVDAVERITDTIGRVTIEPAAHDTEVLLRRRDGWNSHEFAALFGATARAFGRWLDGSRTGPLPHHQLVAAVVAVSARQRVVIADRLPDDFWSGLSTAQHELAEQMLRVPMGATQFGGVSVENESLDAAIMRQVAE